MKYDDYDDCFPETNEDPIWDRVGAGLMWAAGSLLVIVVIAQIVLWKQNHG